MNRAASDSEHSSLTRKTSRIGISILTVGTAGLCAVRELSAATMKILPGQLLRFALFVAPSLREKFPKQLFEEITIAGALHSLGKSALYLISVATSIVAIVAESLLLPFEVGALQNLHFQEMLGIVPRTNSKNGSPPAQRTTTHPPKRAMEPPKRTMDPPRVPVAQKKPTRHERLFLKGVTQLESYLKETGENKENYAKNAFAFFQKAANKGHVTALVNLGYCYERGIGTIPDRKKAEENFRLAAEKGNALARSNLGILYFTEGNFKAAFPLLKLAADQRVPDAQFLIGVSYENGFGVRKDLIVAKEYYQKAAKAGHKEAQDAVARLNQTQPH